jgi:hypothetical protein
MSTGLAHRLVSRCNDPQAQMRWTVAAGRPVEAANGLAARPVVATGLRIVQRLQPGQLDAYW